MRRITSLVLALIMSLSIIIIDNKTSYASTDNCINSSYYTGTYNSDTPMEFSIYSIDKDTNTFTGHVVIDYFLKYFDVDINGSIRFNNNNFVCGFGFDYNYFFSYDTTFTLTVNPFDGSVTGDGGGGILGYSNDIYLEGSINPYYNQTLSYSENDMKMCMDFSYSVYQGTDRGRFPVWYNL